ncbi:MAG: bifunctional aspartate kinase/homoserine dehydrogenase I [Treponema sp.]|nr:bifunctional aspartate kinase/homoserine dehydrogenase I [Treponema sp.]MCL2250933.1 bifunctional aspartate kinase/homoserine dehydrogenase I [Treponema sp.]
MLVLKFGGSSVGSRQGIERIIGILKDKEHSQGEKCIAEAVVVSALTGVTDTLIDLAKRTSAGEKYSEQVDVLSASHKEYASMFLKGDDKKKAVKEIDKTISLMLQVLDGISLLGEISKRSLDLVMSFGERLSANLISNILCANKIEADYIDARDLIITDSNFGKAQILKKETDDNIKKYFKSAKKAVHVITGSIGSTIDGHTTTFGREGSDLTAAVFASSLGAKKLEIYVDVDGILTANPNQVKNALCIEEISYNEAMEISHFGTRVLFPPSVKPALEKNIPIFIRNTFNPDCKGTKITENAAQGKYPIRGISSISEVSLVRIQGSGMVGVAGFSARLFGALAKKGISVMLITQSSSEYSICFALLPEDVKGAQDILNEEFSSEIKNGTIDKPIIENKLSIIAVVGSAMKSTSGISGKFFHALGRNGINIVAIAQGSSETNISAVISSQDESKALNAIHDVFFYTHQKSVNLFLVGTGLIGGTLLDQIAEAKEKLAANMINIKLIGAANYDKMIFSSEGLDPKKTRKLLTQKGKAEGTEPIKLNSAGMPDPSVFIEKMIAYNLPNSCFCDCTASEETSALYEKILHSAIPIVTPNKKANSGSFDYYKKLITYSKQRGIPYLYECTVGAGLPVISTLRDLFLSGDKIKRIEAVLSGTLSFIFNNFDGSMPFSALVREAKAKGYTEPDPRDDLNVMDAARKVLILARECGLSMEYKNVTIEPILPEACFKAKDIEAFFKELEKSDSGYEKRRVAAEKDGKKLRYIAVIEEGKAKLSLRSENEGSPFRSLVDSDNIVVITTERYSKLPMVIKGPGAGAQVTAGGVLADIIRLAKTLV